MTNRRDFQPIECLAVIGSRSLDPKTGIRSEQAKKNKRRGMRTLDKIHAKYGIESVVSGGAPGPDSWGEIWAERNNVPCWVIRPDWNKHGNSAGFIRNADIIDASTRVLSFFDGHSRGTLHSIGLARKNKKKLKIITMEPA